MSTCQEFKTTFKHNLSCIFLSLKAKLKKHFALGHPVLYCTINQSLFLQKTNMNLGSGFEFEFGPQRIGDSAIVKNLAKFWILCSPNSCAKPTSIKSLKSLAFCVNNGWLMENNGPGTHNDKMSYPTIHLVHLSKLVNYLECFFLKKDCHQMSIVHDLPCWIL